MTEPARSGRPTRAQLRGWAALFPLLPLPQLLARRLYLRIWLAVVMGVVVLMLVVGWAWMLAAEHRDRTPPLREWVVRDAQGQVLAHTAPALPPGQPLTVEVPLPEGRSVRLTLERRLQAWPEPEQAGAPFLGPGHRGPLAHERPAWWLRPPYGFVGLLALMGVAAALALYPVVRRLTQRLEGLQRGVQRWGEGDLSVRVPESGEDEVADLSRRFNAAASRIEQLMAAQKSLLANASHELRSPLARIRMALELLDSDAPNPDRRTRARDEILRNMAELDQLIEEILLASRLDAHEADLGRVEPVDLLGLCAEECARAGARLELPEHGSGAQGLESLQVLGVPKLLRRMVRNLLENAVRHGSPHDTAAPDVQLSLQLHPPGLRVCDRGPGVAPAERERIFEPFFRLPGSSEQSGGVGLGLALVKAIAQRHGARVYCEDRPGGGACFVVTGLNGCPDPKA